jgi:plasmid stabilization system protein ParE
MRVVYAPQAVTDLRKIGRESRRVFGASVAAALETYIRATVARIAVMPESGQRLPARPAVRVVPLVRYPFKLFYAVADETVTISIFDMPRVGHGASSDRRIKYVTNFELGNYGERITRIT